MQRQAAKTANLFANLWDGLDPDVPGFDVITRHAVDLTGAVQRTEELEAAAGDTDGQLQRRRLELTAEVAEGTTTATDAAKVLAELECERDVITVGADELNRAAIRRIRSQAMRALHADREAITTALDALVAHLGTVLVDAAEVLTAAGVTTAEHAAVATGEPHDAWATALEVTERIGLVWRLADRLRDLHVCDAVRGTTATMYEWHAWPEHRTVPSRHTPPLDLAAAIADGAVPGVLTATEVIGTWIEPAPQQAGR